jgi:hypothetical protein
VDRQLGATAQQTAQQVCLRRITQCQLDAIHTVVLLPFPRGNEACGRQYAFSLPVRFQPDRADESRTFQSGGNPPSGQADGFDYAIKGPEGNLLN